LAAAGYEFEPMAVDIDERLRPGEPPAAEAARLARAKARAAWLVLSASGPQEGRLVLAADTLVALSDEVFGKPKDLGEARRMLQRLSGRVHQVVTGWCLKSAAAETEGATVSEIRFRDLGDSEIDRYLAAGESMDKAGAYAIQGRGVFLADWIRGSYPNIVGLPVAEVKAAIDAALAKG
jgi:septum formation protein